MSSVIGLDLDNTLIDYNQLFHRVALERGLIPESLEPVKKTIRDRIRELPEGELRWQEVQGMVYGPRMSEARLVDGVADSIRRCRAQGLQFVIISHKTQYANYDDTKTNLREATLEWMSQQGFFSEEGMGFDRSDVFFEKTLLLKINRIRRLECQYFVDDLLEVFENITFPDEVKKVLYAAPSSQVPGFEEKKDFLAKKSIQAFSRWDEIGSFICGNA